MTTIFLIHGLKCQIYAKVLQKGLHVGLYIVGFKSAFNSDNKSPITSKECSHELQYKKMHLGFDQKYIFKFHTPRPLAMV